MNEDCLDFEGGRITVKKAVTTAGSRTHLKGPETASGRRTVLMPTWVMDEISRDMNFDGSLTRIDLG